jgi:hypothetical protein
MKDENEPVSPDELVLRLVWQAFLDQRVVPPIHGRAFLPRPDETDGISVFRLACLADPADALAVMSAEKRDKYGIAVLPAAELQTLGLSVRPAKIDSVPGHSVIPELNAIECGANKDWCKTVQKRLAEIASRGIVRHPAPPGS